MNYALQIFYNLPDCYPGKIFYRKMKTDNVEQQSKLKDKLNSEGGLQFIWDFLEEIEGVQTQQIQLFKEFIVEDNVDFALGSMFGAFIGDALGSYCQFRKLIEQDLLQQAMQMPGKGTFQVKPGQFTDDSQLAAHLLQGLSSYNPSLSFQVQQNSILFSIASHYIIWAKSNPFDIGKTTRNAFKILRQQLYQIKIKQQNEEIDESDQLAKIFSLIQKSNGKSLSNGSLMRISPMAFFISQILMQKENQLKKCKDFQKFIKSQINMTHGNQEIFQVGYAWVELLVQLILRKNNKKSLEQIFNDFVSKYKNDKHIHPWVQKSLEKQYMEATPNPGWALIAFSFGIKKMQTLLKQNQDKLNEETYTQIIKDVIGRAGDTDTNAAIVGSLIGAIVGFKNLPKKYLLKQFQLQLDQEDEQCSYRGPFYQPKLQFYKAMKLIHKFKQSEK